MENKSLNEYQTFQNKTTIEPLEGRWEFLYNQNKIKKIKKEQYRKEQHEKRLQKELEECTFTPKKISHFQLRTDLEEKNNKSYNNIDNLLGRQKNLLEKRNLELERIRQEKNEKDSKECSFKPIMVK